MIRATAHGRAGIIGNPTDGYGGSMIACAIQNRATTTIEPCDKLTIVNQQGTATFSNEDDFVNKGDYFDIVRSVLRYFSAFSLKVKITTQSDIPVQAGLAGSTAVLASTLAAIVRYIGKNIHLYELAEINRDIELNYLECQCGYQDAYMTTFGGLKYLDFRGKALYKPWHQEQYATVEDLTSYVDKLPFVVAHSGVAHHSGQYHRPLRERWLEGDPAVTKAYREIENLAREGKKALINKNWNTLANLMNINHEIQDSLADSGDKNKHLIKVANSNGGLAAKLAGAGGGGTIIVLTLEPERVMSALRKSGVETFVALAPSNTTIDIAFDY